MNIIPFFMCILFIALGYPLANKMVSPNSWYGLRTPTTLSNPETWYAANVLGGKAMMVAGGISFIVVSLMYLLWSGSDDLRLLVGIIVPTFALLIGVVWALAYS